MKRLALVTGLAVATLATTVAPAHAVWLNTHTATSISLLGNEDNDVIGVTCDSGPGTVLVASSPFMPCADLVTLSVKGGGGHDTVDLSGVSPLEFTALATVTLNAADGESDTYIGSQLADKVLADSQDLVVGNGGDDVILSPGIVEAGAGDDTVELALTKAELGPGDDELIDPGYGPLDGGTGTDRVTLDLGSQVSPHVFRLTPTAYVHTYAGSTVTVQIKDIETFEVRFSAGNDVIDVRNGRADTVRCAGGIDTVVADREDVLTDCESVDRTAPETTVTGRTKVKRGRTLRLTLGSDVAGATYRCAVDKKAAVACSSAYVLRTTKLRVGRHTLAVSAVVDGVVDPTPSTHAFRVTSPRKKGHHR